MKPAWFSNALLATSWLLGLAYYHGESWTAWVVVLATAIVGMSWIDLALPTRPVVWLGSLFLLPAIVVAPWPHRAGPLCVVLGLVLAALWHRKPSVLRLGSALLATGTLLVIESIAIVGYRHVTARFPDLPAGLVRGLAALARLAGLQVVPEGSLLQIASPHQVQPFAATWGFLVDPVSFCFLVGGVALMLLPRATAVAEAHRPPVWKQLVGLFLLMATWLPLRATGLLAVYMHRAFRTKLGTEIDALGQFWNPWVQVGLLAVPVLLLAGWSRTLRNSDGACQEPAGPVSRRRGVSALVGGLATLLLTVALLWDPVGPRKGGRVLVDEYHSEQAWAKKGYDTTRTNKRYDTDWFGQGATYNYGCVYDYCTRFYQMARLEKPIEESDLSQCDILIIKLPSGAYSAAERAAIRRFLTRGGGLLIIGDHTAVFGSGVILNELTEEYGFRFRYDCAFDIDTPLDQHFHAPLVPHPIVQWAPSVDFATGCTIAVGASAGKAPMLCAGVKTGEADYFYSNYFPAPKNFPNCRWGSFVQLWAKRVGAGRIAAFTDSTIFSNFSLFEPGKSELMMGMLEWLNRQNVWFDPRWLFFGVGVVGMVLAFLRGQPWSNAWPLYLTGCALGWALAIVGVRGVHRLTTPPAQPLRPMLQMAMDQTLSQARLPMKGKIDGKYTDFGNLEQCMLRLGYFFKRTHGAEALQADTLVIPFPAHYEPKAVRDYASSLEEYVRRGGHALLIDAPENTNSRANTLLYSFGLSVKPLRVFTNDAVVVRPAWPIPRIKSAVEVSGGIPFAWVRGQPVAAWKSYGQGLICAIGIGSALRDSQLGQGRDPAVPRGDMKRAYDFAFGLLRAVAEGPMPTNGPLPEAVLAARNRTYAPGFRPGQTEYAAWLRGLTTQVERAQTEPNSAPARTVESPVSPSVATNQLAAPRQSGSNQPNAETPED